MKKYVCALLCCLTPSVMMTGFALSIDLSLFKGGLSILDSLFLIAMGLTLIGILFLCIAFLKPEKPLPAEEAEALEEPGEADAMPAAEQVDGEADEELEEEEADMDAEPDQTDTSDAQSELQTGEEAEPSEADTPDGEEIAEAAEDQATPEPEADAEPEEEKNYPKLTLTGINNREFKVLPLKDEVTIGRRRTNDLVLADSTISGVHCAITVEDERVYIQDRNSTNGTFLNAKRVFDKTELSKGDVLALGHQEFRIGL